MRTLQLTTFIVGAASLVVSVFDLGPDHGAFLYKTGIAILLVDTAWMQLWPPVRRS